MSDDFIEDLANELGLTSIDASKKRGLKNETLIDSFNKDPCCRWGEGHYCASLGHGEERIRHEGRCRYPL